MLQNLTEVDGLPSNNVDASYNSITVLKKAGLPLNNGTTYSFSMSAFNEVGEGSMSNYVSSMPKS